jgi:DegV family protein with EDD domain
MSAQVAVVTDSTAYLPRDLIERYGIGVVPLQVVIGGTSHDEGDEVSAASVADALRRWVPVTTSRPAPAVLLAAYTAAAEAGAESVVSVHLSADMSGTVESARLAAAEAPVPVRVVDSRSMGMAMGYAVVTGASTAAAGGDLDAVAAAVEKRAAATSVLFYVDTLEYLRRGGRVGKAAALVGSALAIKPLLHLVDGHIEPLERVRTASKAIARLEEIAVGAAGGTACDIAVHHLAAGARAAQLAERLGERIPGIADLRCVEVGAVVGAHVGPGMLAVVVAPQT